jgi:dTDP-4-amino-4,6-dideoxygalactose transaminase
MDEAQLESLVTPRTRAIVPVHYAGVGCEMDAILAIARRHGLEVVEDCPATTRFEGRRQLELRDPASCS